MDNHGTHDRLEGAVPLTRGRSCSSSSRRHPFCRRRSVSDVLGAPTDDQVDVGSAVEARHDEENAQTVRRRYLQGAGVASSLGASVGRAAPNTAAARVTGTTMAFDKVLEVSARGILQLLLLLVYAQSKCGIPIRGSASTFF